MTATPAVAAGRPAIRAGLLVGLLGAAGVLAAPAAAQADPPPHPERDTMGSTLARHEGAAPAVAEPAGVTGVRGTDVSGWQGPVDWRAARSAGARFGYVKATEGTTYTSAWFWQQYDGAYRAELVRGAYHFALPDRSSGRAQAEFFVRHGGAWSPDGRTLPPLLDIEYDPYGPACYGLSQRRMVSWLHEFSDRVQALTGRRPAVYTTTDWWRACTGDHAGLGASPLFIARWGSSPGTLPRGWGGWALWQYAGAGRLPGDQDVFHGSAAQLVALARG